MNKSDSRYGYTEWQEDMKKEVEMHVNKQTVPAGDPRVPRHVPEALEDRVQQMNTGQFTIDGPVPNTDMGIPIEGRIQVSMDEAELESIRLMGLRDHATLVIKGREYGPSWKQRGGIGAFMMMARKWDRIENQVKRKGYDIFECVMENPLESGILDDIGDLRRYLFLIEDHVRKELRKAGKL